MILLVGNMLYSKLHCQKGFNLILFFYIRSFMLQVLRLRPGGEGGAHLASRHVHAHSLRTELAGSVLEVPAPTTHGYHIETLTIYKLSPRKFTTQNNLHQ